MLIDSLLPFLVSKSHLDKMKMLDLLKCCETQVYLIGTNTQLEIINIILLGNDKVTINRFLKQNCSCVITIVVLCDNNSSFKFVVIKNEDYICSLLTPFLQSMLFLF